MKLKVSQSDLSYAIKRVKNACTKSNDRPVLQTIRLSAREEQLTLTATRLDCTFESVIKADVKEEGEIYVYANKLDDIIGKLDDFVSLETTDNSLKIKSGKSKYQINVFALDKFPSAKNIEYEHVTEVDFKEFKKGVRATILSCSNLQNNIMSGVCLHFENGMLKLGSTNTYRLSHYEILAKDNFSFKTVVPKFVLNEILANDGETIRIELAKNKAKFGCNNETYETNVLTGEFPLYEKIIPKNSKTALIDKDLLIRSIEKVVPLADYEKNIVKFSFHKNSLTLNCMNNDGISTDVIEIKYDGEPLDIKFDYKYILDGLKISDKQEIKFEFETSNTAVILDVGFMYVIMPIRSI